MVFWDQVKVWSWNAETPLLLQCRHEQWHFNICNIQFLLDKHEKKPEDKNICYSLGTVKLLSVTAGTSTNHTDIVKTKIVF